MVSLLTTFLVDSRAAQGSQTEKARKLGKNKVEFQSCLLCPSVDIHVKIWTPNLMPGWPQNQLLLAFQLETYLVRNLRQIVIY